MTGWAHLVGTVLVWLAAVPATASVVKHAFTPWRDTPAGRHLMAYMGVIALVLILYAARTVVPEDTAWFAWLRLAVFAAVPVVLAWRLVLQIWPPPVPAEPVDTKTESEETP